MALDTFIVQMRKGLGECAIAWQRLPLSLLDRLLGRSRYAYGVGLCSPVDLIRNYIEGKTEDLAQERLSTYLRGRRGKSVANGFAGELRCKGTFDMPWMSAAKQLAADVSGGKVV